MRELRCHKVATCLIVHAFCISLGIAMHQNDNFGFVAPTNFAYFAKSASGATKTIS
jgi:hypothetical protein